MTIFTDYPFSPSQKFPGTLLPPTYPDPDNPGHLLARSEVERRSDYIQLLHEQLGEQHPLSQLVSQCLHNIPAQRPSAEELHQRLEAARSQIEEAYGSQHVNVEIARLQVTMMSVLRTKDAKAAETDREQRRLRVSNWRQMEPFMYVMYVHAHKYVYIYRKTEHDYRQR